jgi:imidazolonepropionase-like amidohydrolase
MGTVEAGKLANLVVLTEDPSADIRRLRSVRFVVKRGRRHERSAFEAHPGDTGPTGNSARQA